MTLILALADLTVDSWIEIKGVPASDTKAMGSTSRAELTRHSSAVEWSLCSLVACKPICFNSLRSPVSSHATEVHFRSVSIALKVMSPRLPIESKRCKFQLIEKQDGRC